MSKTSQDGSQGEENFDKNKGEDNSHNDFVMMSEEFVSRSDSPGIWSKEELKEAQACNILEIDENILKSQPDSEDKASRGSNEAGEPPESASEGEDQAEQGGYSYPAPYTSYPIFDDYRVWPYCTIGKLFFKRDGGSYVCSATSIGNNAIWTAGHCLHSGNNSASGWATDVVFIPAYRNRETPLGQWKVKQLFTSKRWYEKGNPGGLIEDWGGAILYPLDGKKISQRVGWLGFAWNWSRHQHWYAMGYPADPPYDGQKLIANPASFAYTAEVSNGVPPTGIGCDMTGGSSGGPWITQFGNKNYLNGNNSYRRIGKSQEMFSPYFSEKAKKFKDFLVEKEV